MSVVANVGSPVPANTQFDVDIILSGVGAPVTGADVLLIVGDGGATLGGDDLPATSPKIIGNTILPPGGIFATNNAGDNPFNDFGNGPETQLGGNFTVTATGTVNAPDGSLLARFRIDTTGVPADGSSFELTLLGDSTFLNGEPVTIAPTSITIIPERASALLLIGALPFLRRRSA
jgi:hypothetical protein